VTQTPARQEQGSILSTLGETDDLYLIKPGYGRGALRSSDDTVLLSANTWHFSIPAVRHRLERAAGDRFADGRGVQGLLEDALVRCRRGELATLFEHAFRIEPQLIATGARSSDAFLRLERDLDQLTLAEGSSLVRAIEVPADRAIFLKVPADFENPIKRAFLFDAYR
jgi:hypothetical protein